MSSLLLSLSKLFFPSVPVFLISSISFRFLEFHFSAYVTCYCLLSTFFIRALDILIVVAILNSFVGSSNISAISEAGADARMSLQIMFFVFQYVL